MSVRHLTLDPISDRRWGFTAALATHAALFILGSLAWQHRAEYGMDASQGAVDIELVAAPMTVHSAPAPIAAPAPAPVTEANDIAQPDKPSPAQPPATPVSDGRSPVPGADATTLHRTGAGETLLKPGYARNPPPAYPADARRLKQEGRVMLEVSVTPQGRVGALRVSQSSGFPLLDDAALQGVRNWRFRPATAGGVPMATTVEIPIRFQLK